MFYHFRWQNQDINHFQMLPFISVTTKTSDKFFHNSNRADILSIKGGNFIKSLCEISISLKYQQKIREDNPCRI